MNDQPTTYHMATLERIADEATNFASYYSFVRALFPTGSSRSPDQQRAEVSDFIATMNQKTLSARMSEVMDAVDDLRAAVDDRDEHGNQVFPDDTEDASAR